MVCGRCIKAVHNILCELKIEHGQVLLGEVSISGQLHADQKSRLEGRLKEEGFELIDDKKTRIIEQIKRLLIKRVNSELDELTDNLSEYLTSHLHLDYPYLSHLFSSIEGITIEKYFI